jgi:hypothetical protein
MFEPRCLPMTLEVQPQVSPETVAIVKPDSTRKEFFYFPARQNK